MEKKPDFKKPTLEDVRHWVYLDHCKWISGKNEELIENVIDSIWKECCESLQSQNERLLSALKSVMGMWRIANAAHYGRNSDAVAKFTTLINEIEKQ